MTSVAHIADYRRDRKPPGQENEMPPWSLDQELALDDFSEFLLSKDLSMSLVGPAGTGKTTLLKELVRMAVGRTWNIHLTAPTHKAAAQLRQTTGRDAETTHRLLGVQLKQDKRTGREYLKAGTPAVAAKSLIVVDEASMLTAEMLKILLKTAERMRCKVLFVGDAAQLSPVNEDSSETVDVDRCPWRFSDLATVHRQARDNPIIAAATFIREAEPDNLPILETSLNGSAGICVMDDKRAWADLMVESCSEKDVENRYLSYTNAAADAAAKAIRQKQFGDAAQEPYLPGEHLVINSRCVLTDGKGKKAKKTVIENNDELTVMHVYRDGIYYKLDCRWNQQLVQLTAFGNYRERESHLKTLANSANSTGKWSDYFAEKDRIADLRSASSLTIHKAQGSTFNDVFINFSNIGRCRDPLERRRLLYVAITRASNCVYIVGADDV